MSIISSQKQQAWARLLFAVAGLFYLQQHAVFFDQYRDLFLSCAAAYFIYNLLSLPAIKRRPLSAFRTLFAPAFDIAIVCFAAVIDGGHGSGIYFMLLVIILGNSFRYGNALLLYTQALAVIGLIGVAVYTLFNMHLDLDRTLLVWQLAGLLVIPSYVYLIGEKAERAIRGQSEAEEASFKLLDQGPLPVFTYDLDANNQPRILYANAAIGEVFRDDYTRLIGEQPDMLALLEDGEEMLEFCRRSLQEEQPTHAGAASDEKKVIYIRGRDRNDNILRLMCTATRLRWRNQWIGVCFILDITQRETSQAKLENMHRQGYLSTMVAGIVHDFRNILTSIIGYAEVMQMESASDIHKDQLQAIIDAGERGSDMVRHLLTLGRTAESDDSEHCAGADLHAPLENITGLARLQLPAHIQLSSCIKPPLPDVACSLLEIEQIMLNLIHNAGAAIDGEGQIHVRCEAAPDHALSQPGHPALCIEIQDNGAGIAQEDIDNIFKPFWTTRKHEGGSGLGLAMVQRIVKLRHGSIEVDSQPGKGTTFTLHLPPYIPDNPTDKPATAGNISSKPVAATDEMQPDADVSPCRILLVDDTPDVLKIHEALLKHMHHEPVTAENGKVALDLFRNADEPFDLLITDFRMPLMNGLELIEQVRKENSDIPIIMITAFGEDEQLQQTAQYGVQLMNKPVTMEKLKACIHHALASKHDTA